MATAAEKLRAEVGGDVKPISPARATRSKVADSSDFDLFHEANAVEGVAVLDFLGIEHQESGRGTMAKCPGCSEDGALLCKDGGLKCLHDRCAHAGPSGKPGYRTNVDLVAHVKQIKPADAAKLICEMHNIEVPRSTYVDDFQTDELDTYEAAPESAESAPAKQPAASEWVITLPEQIFAPLAEPDYLIAGLIRRGGLLEIQAYGGSGKSWLAVNLALSLASGRPWLGRLETKPSTVVCLDYENGFYEMARRLQGNAKALGLPMPVQGIGLITMPDTYMTSDTFEGSVTKLAATYQVIIIDTLKAASPGIDENDSKMRESLDRLRRVGERTGCTFVVLIHSKKKSNSAVEIDARERGRGSSAIFDAADAQLGVEYEQGKPLQIMQTKARSGRYIEPFQVTIEDGDDGAVHVVASDSPKATSKSSDDFENVVCVAVLEALRANPGASTRLLTEKSGKRYATVSAALEQLERNGAAKNAGNEKAGRWFAI